MDDQERRAKAWKAVEDAAREGQEIVQTVRDDLAGALNSLELAVHGIGNLERRMVQMADELWRALGIDPANPPTTPNEPEPPAEPEPPMPEPEPPLAPPAEPAPAPDPPPLDSDQPAEALRVVSGLLVDGKHVGKAALTVALEDAGLWSEHNPERPRAIVRIDGWAPGAHDLGRHRHFTRGAILEGGEIRPYYGSGIAVGRFDHLFVRDTLIKCAEQSGIGNLSDAVQHPVVGLDLERVKIDGGWDFINDRPKDWNVVWAKELNRAPTMSTWGWRLYWAIGRTWRDVEVFDICREHGGYDSDNCSGVIRGLVVHDVGACAFQDRNTKRLATSGATIFHDCRSWNTAMASDKSDEGYNRGGNAWSFHGGRAEFGLYDIDHEFRGPEDPAVAAVLSRLLPGQVYASGALVAWWDRKATRKNGVGVINGFRCRRASHPLIGDGALAKFDGCDVLHVNRSTFGPSGVREPLHVDRKGQEPLGSLRWGDDNVVVGQARRAGKPWTPVSF